MSLVRPRRHVGRRGGRGMGASSADMCSLYYATTAGLGDTATVALTPVDQLALQVNRFGPDAPAAYQFHTTAFATGNPLDLDLASTAMLIYQRRAIDSYAKFADAASQKLIDNANAGMSDPVGWVTANLADVTATVKGYGDSVGLPAAAGASLVDQITGGGPLGIPVWGWAIGGAAALWLLTRKGRR